MLQEITTASDKNLYTLIKEYAIFNQTANTQMISWLKTSAADLLSTETPILKDTLRHIWQVEMAWLACLQNNTYAITYQQTLSASLEVVWKGILEESEKFMVYILALNEAEIKMPVHVCIPNILDCNISRYELIQLCFDHSACHRAQIISIARHIGLTDAPIITDFMQRNLQEEISFRF